MDTSAIAFLASLGTIVAFLIGGWAGHARARSEIDEAKTQAKTAQAHAMEATRHIPVILDRLDRLVGDLEKLAVRLTDTDVRDRGRFHDLSNRLQVHEARLDVMQYATQQLCEGAGIAPPLWPQHMQETPVRPIPVGHDPRRRPR